jgi:hypothetical protein
MMVYQRNQHVLCINDKNWLVKDGKLREEPKKGTVYTVAAYDGHSFEEPCISLQEFPPDEQQTEFWYRTWRFRPLKPIKVEDFVATKKPVLENV